MHCCRRRFAALPLGHQAELGEEILWNAALDRAVVAYYLR